MKDKLCNVCIHTHDKKYTENVKSTSKFREDTSHSTIPHPDALNNQIWDKDNIVYWRRDSSYEHINDKDMDNLIKLALLESSYQTPLIIRQRRKSTADAQIVINFRTKKEDPFFKSNSTLAYAYGPARGLGGDCVFNADVLWLLRDEPLTAGEAVEKGYIDKTSNPENHIKFFDPLHTMKHEVGGHSLGMNHITDISRKYDTIMYPFYNGVRKFSQTDLEYLYRLYGKASLSSKIKAVLSKRINSFFGDK